MHSVAGIVVVLIVARALMELLLASLNRRHVLAYSDSVPDVFRGVVDETGYRKSVAYTLAKNKLDQFETLYDSALLIVILFSGVLPLLFEQFRTGVGATGWAMAAFIFTIGLILSLPNLPLAWYSQFRLEQRFGFNTTTQKLWWFDRLKGLLLAALLGYPLLVLVLKLVDWTGTYWWLWAWAVVFGFQLIMVVLAPVLIMPLFNKFTPLPEGSLRERLLRLGERTQFRSQNIQVMDGSKRSRHSNAFFTGLGRWRKIVLFDTLIQQLTEPELEAVLAHEIGHYKKRHIPKMILFSSLSLFAGFFVIAWLSRQQWFYAAFGFPTTESVVPALLLFALLSRIATFWFSPLLHFWSRRYEYQADRYAGKTMGEVDSLCGALRKLNEKNLSNLTPHPAYSGFYYSHPTLLERERSLRQLWPGKAAQVLAV
jgi:STE24 endopeptidase